MKNIAIVVITYNRKSSLERLIDCLVDSYYIGDTVDLIISIDRSNLFAEINSYAEKVIWKYGKKFIQTFPKRLGLKKHVMECGKLLDIYENIIVLEDDLYVSKNFYQYTKLMIEKYNDNLDIAGISLYNYPRNQYANLPFYPQIDQYDVYFMKVASSWGQVWSKKSWKLFLDWLDKNIDIKELHIPTHIKEWDDKSWLKYHHAYCANENKYFVYPRVALSTNFSEPGEHASSDSTFQVEILQGMKDFYNLPNNIVSATRYDAFFESENVIESFKNSDDYTLDLYNKKCFYNRYLITTRLLDYKVMKSYGMRMRPWEANITNNIEGACIFIYDTSISDRTYSNIIKKIGFDARKYNYIFKLNSLKEVSYVFFSLSKEKLTNKIIK